MPFPPIFGVTLTPSAGRQPVDAARLRSARMPNASAPSQIDSLQPVGQGDCSVAATFGRRHSLAVRTLRGHENRCQTRMAPNLLMDGAQGRNRTTDTAIFSLEIISSAYSRQSPHTCAKCPKYLPIFGDTTLAELRQFPLDNALRVLS